MRSALKPNRYESDGVIANDRDLLTALGLSDADASTYVQRTRQTLNNKLRAKKDGEAPDDYFSCGDLLMLVFGAARESKAFDDSVKKAALDYIRASRIRDGMSKKEAAAYEVVVDTLSTGGEVNLQGARGVILLLPDFAGMNVAGDGVVSGLRGLAHAIGEGRDRPWALILSSSVQQARAASDALRLDHGTAHAVSHDHVEHYMPAVLVYRGDDDLDPFAITANGGFVFTPQYRAPMMLACLKQMLPAQLRDTLFTPAADSRRLAAS